MKAITRRGLAGWLGGVLGILLTGAAQAGAPPTLLMADLLDAGSVTLPPVSALRVDTTGAVPVAGRWPERVVLHLMKSPLSAYYWTPFRKDQTVYELSADTLTPVKGSPPFTGLAEDTTVFVMLGSEIYPHSLDLGVMLEFVTLVIRIEAQ